jgi:hypothetical protein
MKNKIMYGIGLGVLAGIVDVIPMLLQKLPWDSNLSAFSMWVVIGFLLSITHLQLKGIVKGIVVSYVTIIPCVILIGWKEPASLIPIFIMTFILGSLLGHFIDRLGMIKK